MTITRCRVPFAAGMAVMLTLSMAILGVLASWAARPKPEPCAAGRFLLEAKEPPLVPGATGPEVLLLEADDTVAITSGCAVTAATVKAKRKATKVTTTFAACGPLTEAKLKVKIAAPTCTTLTGKLKVKRERARKFTGRLVPCGDGVFEPEGGEECEPGVVACDAGLVCQLDCLCEPGTSTTSTTTGGGSTTSTTLVGTTSTSLPGGTSTTTTTLPTVPGPDPATVAPPLDTSSTTSFAASTAFLFGGPSPVQFNVTPGAIDPIRAAVIRGTVLDNTGAPLETVLIHILDHPEFGQTLSRSDGAFDLVVNGGGLLTLQYEKSGFLPAQRQVLVPWQDYVAAPELMLCPLDPMSTQVNLATITDIAVARGSEKTDADGTRQATLLVEPGTAAEIVMPDGSTQALDQITVRATEYTVGAAGPQMMPAALPAQSGYTYAVEFSVDEAMAEGAAMVKFDRPIPTYVENFVGFPAGTPVPAGYYDKVRGAWVAAPNGIVIDVVGISGDLADLDVTGDGVADGGAALSDLGIDDAERATLATLYTAGQSLWRVPVDHFTAWDYNWPFGPPDDAEDPEDAGAGANSDDEPIDASCEANGSVVECENQVLGEEVPIAGTPYALNYRSDRVPGRLDSLDVRLSGASVPASLQAIRVRATVAGQTTEQTFPPAANQRVVMTWDGTDVYGRPVQGGQQVTGSIEYVYPAVYKSPAAFGQSFSVFGGAAISGDRTASTVSASMSFSAVLREGITDARGLGLGGWTLGVHHFYDPVAQVLHLGTGKRRRAESVARVIDRLALPSFPNEGVGGFVMGPDGALYISGVGSSAGRVRRLTRDGTVTTFAGGGPTNPTPPPPYGEDGPAVGASLFGPSELAFGPDGSLYIMESSRVILRVGLDGIIRRVAGRERFSNLGDPCPGTPVPDGTVATDTDLCMQHIAVGPDGTIYFIERSAVRDHVVRRIGSDGLITTAAGTGQDCFGGGCGDGGPAVAASFSTFAPSEIAVGPDGSLFLSDANTIRRVTPDGIIARFAGAGPQGFFGDGLPALDANFCGGIGNMTFGLDGALYLVDHSNKRIRRIAPDGIVSTVVGSGPACDPNFNTSPLTQTGDGGPALQAGFGNLLGVAVAPDGEIFVQAFVTGTGIIVRRVGKPMPGFSAADILIASEDGRSLYAFDPGGRHLATFDAFTGAVRREFGYDAEDRLASVTERTGGTDNVTTIERSASGAPTAIVGPFGGRTTLTVDAQGFLASIRSPAGDTTTLGSTPNGLLTSFIAPGGHESAFTYDAAGRLLRHEDPADGSQDLDRSGEPVAFTVARTTALGRTTSHQVETLPNRVQRRVVTAPDGTETTAVETLDAGTSELSTADGTTMSVVSGPDPRFGMEAAIAASLNLTFPSSLAHSVSGSRSAVLQDVFDPLSLQSQTETTTVNGRSYTQVYDAATRTFTATSPAGRQVLTTLDTLGRIASEQVVGLEPTTYAYDARGRLLTITDGTGPSARTTTLTYDAGGFLAALTDAIDRTVGLVNDASGRATQFIRDDGAVFDYELDADGRPVSLTPPGRPAHAFAYTARGQIETFSPPDVGPESGPIAFEYDADRQPTAITFSDGESLAFSYAPSGRLTGMTLPRGTFGYAYGATTGLLDAIATPEGNTLAYDYDGPLITRTTWSGEVAGQVDRSYTADLRLASESVNGGFAIDFSYDADALPTGVGALALTRDPAHGLVVGATLGVVADTREFNGFAEQTAYEATVDGSAVYMATYVRDAIGRITRKTETVLGTTTVYEYEHDVVGRLTRVVEDDAEAATYEYDGTGNRLSVARPGGTDTGTYDAQDRLVEYDGATYAHDAAGRVRTRTAGPLVTEHSYDRLGNLLGVTLPDGTDIEYVVDGRGRRVGKRVDGVLVQGFLYRNALQPAAEVDGAGSVVSRFAYVGRHPAFMQRDGATYRILTDHLGSPRLVIDVDTGTVAQRMDYDEFGIVTLDTNPGFQPFGFAGGLYDPQTRLTRFGVRDYDAETGRFTAKEPLKPLEGQDVYAYAANDPVNLIDPFGTDPWDVDWDGPTLEGPLHEEGQPIKERLVQAEQELERLQDRGAARGRNNEGNRALRERVTARIRLLKGQLREIVSRSQRLLNAGGLASKAMCLLAVPEILDLYFRAEENGMTMIEQSEADEAQAVRDGTETFVYMMGPFILVKDVNDPFWGGDA